MTIFIRAKKDKQSHEIRNIFLVSAAFCIYHISNIDTTFMIG